jgi:hypothetical protein
MRGEREGARGSMRSNGVRWRGISLSIGAALILAGCGHHHLDSSDNEDDQNLNQYPTNYKADILGGMHAYLNNPTGIRDAAISEPMLKPVANGTRYVVCVQFNGKMNANGGYAGDKVYAAVFLGGHFDHFVEQAREPCAGATLTPFPDLEKLPR